MADPGQKLMADMSVVNDVTSSRHLTHGCFQGNPIRAQVLHPALPPVGLFFKYLVELSLGYAVTSAGFNEHLPAYASVTQSFSNTFCNLLAGCECTSVDCDDRHTFTLLLRIPGPPVSNARISEYEYASAQKTRLTTTFISKSCEGENLP